MKILPNLRTPKIGDKFIVTVSQKNITYTINYVDKDDVYYYISVIGGKNISHEIFMQGISNKTIKYIKDDD